MTQMTTCDLHNETIIQLQRDLAAANEQVEMVSDIKELLGVNSWHNCYSAIAELKESLTAANARAEQNENDAERYRYARQNLGAIDVLEWQQWRGIHVAEETISAETDAAIDAAIAAKEGP